MTGVQTCALPIYLDDPEIYVRAAKGKKASKILKEICSTISKEFSSIKF